MLMNSKTIHSDIMKNDSYIHQVLTMSLTRKMEPGCDSNDCSISKLEQTIHAK